MRAQDRREAAPPGSRPCAPVLGFRGSARRARARCRIDQHLVGYPRRLCDPGHGSRRSRLRREAPGRQCGRRREGGRDRAAHRPQARRGLYPAAPSVMDALHRDRQDPRGAARVPHEPEPAIERPSLGGAQAPAAIPLADRRLRRALRGRHVPDHPGEARAGERHRGAADRRHAGRHVQLRPSPRDFRRRIRRLVRGGLGADDERDGVFREGRDRTARQRQHRHGRDRRTAA